MQLADTRHVHFVGIGGAGMSAIAKVLLERGIRVSGSDLKASRVTAMLEVLGATITIGHAADAIGDCDLIVASAAIASSNPELAAGRARGLRVISRGEALAAVLEGTLPIVVAGTHGKTTTTSMIVSTLRAAGRDPTYLVGAGLNDSGTNAKHGRDPVAVAESDESDGSFLLLSPHVAVVTNIEADHLDHWGSLEQIHAAFARFMASTSPEGAVIVPADDRAVAESAAQSGRRVVGFGAGGEIDAAEVVLHPQGARFTLVAPSGRADVALRVPGYHNVRNALAAAAACLEVGMAVGDVARGLGSYAGVERRFQIKGRARGVTVVDDYAHHPTEIRATLSAARLTDARRVVAVFQPHRYSRTAALAGDFGAAFGDADRVVVTDVYGAGERPVPGVTGKLVANAVTRSYPGRAVAYLPHRDELLSYLQATVRAGDVLMTLGAGDVTTVGPELLARLGER